MLDKPVAVVIPLLFRGLATAVITLLLGAPGDYYSWTGSSAM